MTEAEMTRLLREIPTKLEQVVNSKPILFCWCCNRFSSWLLSFAFQYIIIVRL